MNSPGPPSELSAEEVLRAFDRSDRPSTPMTAADVAADLECRKRIAEEKLEELVDRGDLYRKELGPDDRVWWRPAIGEPVERLATEGRTALEQFGAFINSVEDYAIFMLDPDGVVTSWNEGARRMKGYTTEEIQGEHFSIFYTDTDVERGVPGRNLERARTEGNVEDEGWRVRGDGSRFRANVVITAVRDDDGTLLGYAKVTRDLTERQEHEERLRRERDFNEQLLETVPVSISVITPDGEFVRANSRTLDRLGIEAADLERYSVDSWDLYDEEGGVIPREERPWHVVSETGESVYEYQCQIDLPDRGRRWHSINAARITDAVEGESDRIIIAVIDITTQKESERQLRRERNQTEELLRTAPISITVRDADGNTLLANHRAQAALGLSEREIIEGSYDLGDWTILGADGRRLDPDETPSERVRASGEPVSNEEIAVEKPDGERVWFNANAAAIYNGDGDLDRIITVAEEITERKRRERELKRYETIIEAVGDPVYELDADGRYVFVNDAFVEGTGYAREDIIGESVATILPPEDVERGRTVIRELLRDRDRRSATWEYTRVLADGKRVPAETHVALMPFDERGSFAGTAGVIRDITERKERERRLERRKSELETELSEILGRISDAFYALDAEYRFTHVNERAEELLEHSREDLLGELVWDVFPDANENVIWDRFHEAMTSQRPISFEISPDSLESWFEVHAYPSETGISVYFRDVTDRIEREQELERYKTIVETVDDGIYAVDEDYRFTLVNPSLAELYNREPDGLLGRHISTVVDPQTVRRGEELRERLSASDTGAATVEIDVEAGDGEVRTLEIKYALAPDEGTVGVIRDITDRKARERELERYRTIVETVNDGIYTVGADGRFTTVNETYAEMTGYSRDELVGSPVSLVVEEGTAAVANAHERELLSGDRDTVRLEADLRTADGVTMPAEATFALLPADDGTAYERVGVVRDITDRKAQERALEESERRYRTLVEHFPNGAVALVDEDIRYRTLGGTPVEEADATVDELKGRPVGEVLPTGLSELLVPRYEAAFGGESSSFEGEIGDHTYQFHIVPVRDDDGDIFAAMGMSQDITDRKEYERYLHDAKAQLEAATEAGAVGTWDWQIPEDRFVAGPSLAKQFGVDPDAAVEGVPLEEFVDSIHGDDRMRVMERIQGAIETCSEYEAEYRVWNADGELRWVVARGHVDGDGDGNPVRFRGALADITARKHAEIELQRHKNQLQTLFRILPVGVVVADTDGRIEEANEAAKEIWGDDAFDAEGVGQYEQYAGWWADTGDPVGSDKWTMARVLQGEEVTDPDVFEVEIATGERRIVMVHGMPIRDDTGTVTRGVITQTDITERREYQRKLEESERRYRTLAENFPEGVVALFDKDLRYSAGGGQLLDDVGIDIEKALGSSVRERYPDELADEIEPNFWAALAGEMNTFEVEYLGRHLRAHTLPIRNADDEVDAGMLVVQDITERTRYRHRLEETIEKLEASNERLQQFAYISSHDLQEPLRMISSYLQLLEDRYRDSLDEDAREFIDFAVDAADRMREMIRDLLKYSRVESEGKPVEPTDVNAVIDRVLDQLHLQIEENDADVVVEDLPTVPADENQLEQVFQNLVSNAIKYRGEESPRIGIDAERRGDAWQFTVRDTGIGIDPDRADRIFEVFKRLHSSEEYPGTGIGLALCKKIVQRHGGRIWVDSEPGAGSTFSFTIPVENRWAED